MQIVHPPLQLAPGLIVRRQNHGPYLVTEDGDPDAGGAAIGIGELQCDPIGKACRYIPVPVPTGQVACLAWTGRALPCRGLATRFRLSAQR